MSFARRNLLELGTRLRVTPRCGIPRNARGYGTRDDGDARSRRRQRSIERTNERLRRIDDDNDAHARYTY
jgi:hypothetical protein